MCVKKKLVKYFIVMISAAILLTMILLTALVYNLFERRVLEDLRIEAQMMAYIIGREGIPQDDGLLCGELRLTMIDPNGFVLYDNEAQADSMDNHAQRPEVLSAVMRGEGTDIRQSSTLQKSTYYYALRLDEGLVLRVAEETSSIWDIFLHAAPMTMLIIALMMGLCALGANIVTRRLVRPIEQMADQLDDMNGAVSYPELAPFMSMIRKQHEEILRSADMRIQFTANVSHELKTPLTSISGYAELIESGMAKEKQAQRFAGEIHKSANRLLTLINDIIRLSQMDSPTTGLNLETFDAAQLAADTIEQLRIGAAKMGVSLQIDRKSSFLEADRRMVEELVYNLCDNAIRYNVHGGSVRVEVRPVRDQVMICVQDTGIGISQENQERVFERFYRVDKSRSKATGGTGLGLAIVKHIAVKHGASLALESELGRGTTITVMFHRRLSQMKEEAQC